MTIWSRLTNTIKKFGGAVKALFRRSTPLSTVVQRVEDWSGVKDIASVKRDLELLRKQEEVHKQVRLLDPNQRIDPRLHTPTRTKIHNKYKYTVAVFGRNTETGKAETRYISIGSDKLRRIKDIEKEAIDHISVTDGDSGQNFRAIGAGIEESYFNVDWID